MARKNVPPPAPQTKELSPDEIRAAIGRLEKRVADVKGLDPGAVVSQGTPLVAGNADIPRFNREALVRALRIDQAGQSTFPEFLKASWEAGVVGYDVDLENRKVTYYGALGESYVEVYPAVQIKK